MIAGVRLLPPGFLATSSTDALWALVGAYPYLFATVLGLVICLAAAVALRPQWTLILGGGLLNTTCFHLLVYFEDVYWSPVRLFDWPVGIEDVLCSFHVGALALIPMAVILRESLSWEHEIARPVRRYLLAGVPLPALFLVLMPLGLGPMGSLIATNLLATGGLLLARARLWPLCICGLAGFPLLYWLIVRTYFLLWPGFITQWNPEGIWGAVVLGLPRGEIAWAFAFGAFWPVFVGYVFDVRIERRERASGRVARLEPGMAAPTPEGP